MPPGPGLIGIWAGNGKVGAAAALVADGGSTTGQDSRSAVFVVLRLGSSTGTGVLSTCNSARSSQRSPVEVSKTTTSRAWDAGQAPPWDAVGLPPLH